ncbi:MAG: rhodanese-like domain-containing protein [Azonexus sp.]|jgi:rhodanese-related sulfurtransferase|nr:rhodanese-like domain-containing protein [Azonexus sp.]
MQTLDPLAAHEFLQRDPDAVFVDCRTEVEFMCVGHPKGAEHVAWREAPEWEVDPEFSNKVKHLVAGNLARPVLLICRSGVRSREAGEALEAAGFATVINVSEGFEGALDEHHHRGTLGGWRFHGLPWHQN